MQKKIYLTRSKFILYLIFFGISLSSFSQNSYAHSRGESYSKWLITEQGAELTYTLSLKDINKLSETFQGSEPDWEERVSQHIQANTQLFDNDFPCKIQHKFISKLANGFLQITGSFHCNSTERLSIKIDSIFTIDSRHMHIARVNFLDGDISEKVFLENDREWLLYEHSDTQAHSQGSTFFNYLILGAEHIVTGWDHLAFLSAIFLLLTLMQASTRTLIIIISGFTLGHSASLLLTVLGYLNPNPLVVESLIAFSIALLAIESVAFKVKNYKGFSLCTVFSVLLYLLASNLFFKSAIPALTLIGLSIFIFCYFKLTEKFSSTLPQLLLTLLFGLVHGFGFAGSLQDIGLPQDRLIIALLSFNIGVELGQVIIVGLAILVLSQFRKRLPKIKNDLTIEISSAALCGIGIFWFIERSVL